MRVFRARRMATFETLLGIEPQTRVVDVGGSFFNWHLSRKRPYVILVNLKPEFIGDPAPDLSCSRVVADGRMLPFRSGSVDVVFCNSVIEHVGGRDDQAALASEIRRVGGKYCVQTPHRYAPIEPHFLFPFFQFLPKRVRVLIARYFTPMGWIYRPTPAQIRELVDEIRLLGPREVSAMFRDGQLATERFLGLPKSIIAYRTDGAGEMGSRGVGE
ncbi:MAG: class I SAM-dependent methyltransferase [Gemmatimonadota bacterium]